MVCSACASKSSSARFICFPENLPPWHGGPCGSNQVKGSSPEDSHRSTPRLPPVRTFVRQSSLPRFWLFSARGSGVGIMILLRLLHFSWEAPKPTANRQISSFLHLLTLTDNGSSDCGSCFHLVTRSFSFNTTSPILTTLNPDDVVSDVM